MTPEEKKRWVRENLPRCARFASEVAEVSGEGVKMVYASENGHTFGRPSAVGIRLSETVVGSMWEYAAEKGSNER